MLLEEEEEEEEEEVDDDVGEERKPNFGIPTSSDPASAFSPISEAEDEVFILFSESETDTLDEDDVRFRQ